MPYPRFTKVIINHFISKDKTISMRNRINIHTVRNDTLLGTLKFVSKTQDYQMYGALILEEMINQDIKDSKAYNTYLNFATGKATPKNARKFKKKSTIVPTAGVVIEDTPGESVSKKKAPTKFDRGKGMDLLFEAAFIEVAQLKKTLKKSKLETHKLHASSSGDGVSSQPKVPNESEDKTTDTNEGTGTKPGDPDVPKYQSESENESWGDSDDDSNDDDSDDVINDDDDDDDVNSDAGGDNEASDSEKTDFDEDENPNLNQNDDEEEEYEEEYVSTPDNYEFSDDDEEYEELYKDVNVRLKDAEHEEERKGDAEMTDVGQEKSYEQVEDDAHVTLTATYVTQKIEGPMQSFSVSLNFSSQFLNLDNVLLINIEVVSMMNVKVRHEEPSTHTPSLLTIPITSTPTPTPAPTTKTTTTSILALLDFSSLFGFDQRVSTLEKELSQFKQSDHSAQLLATIKSQIPAMVDTHLGTRLCDSIQEAFRLYTAELEKKAQAERKRYIDLVENSVKDIIKNKVKSQLPQILPKEVSKFSTPVIQSTISESLENVILAKSSSQPKSTYEATTSLTEDLYDTLVKSYKLDKDLFESYGKSYSLKRDRKDKDKDEDPPVGSDQGLKRRKTSKDVEPSKGSKSKESKSSSSKGTKSQSKSSGKSAQAEESVFETADTKMPHNQGSDLGNTDDQPNVEADSKLDWFKKPERPLTPDPDWNAKNLLILDHLRLG
ncbi:hypothetical protein Tco_0455797 [Tanacetum coccineum]